MLPPPCTSRRAPQIRTTQYANIGLLLPAAVLFLVSTVLGFVSMASSLLWLGFALKSTDPNSLFQSWGLPPMDYGQIVVSICKWRTDWVGQVGSSYFACHHAGVGEVGSVGLQAVLACINCG